MRRAARRWGLGLAVGLGPLVATRAQVAPATLPATDSVQTAAPTFVADTVRRAPVVTAEPTDAVTRRSAVRIGAAIVVLTLTTLLLYNVRSR